MMIYDVSATRADALLKQDGRDDRGFEVRSSRFSELRTQNFELRVAPVAHILLVSLTLTFETQQE